jgi:hypothetical protein
LSKVHKEGPHLALAFHRNGVSESATNPLTFQAQSRGFWNLYNKACSFCLQTLIGP